MIPHIGWMELTIFAVIVLLLFGSRLPSVMRSLGSSIVEFKKGTRDAEQELDDKSPRV
ncbi:MAG TPA: twin-arginine translocase TatA/TatE family subunit [Planctomycetaceae bacterium]|nr:twin-arginine translocase TatA/TatE family subunit [Planctomycetaceae bacterium]